MSEVKIEFQVLGLPQPAGSKRAFPFRRRDGSLGVNVSDDNPKARSWKDCVAFAGREAFLMSDHPTCGPGLLDSPLKLTVAFYLPRPKGHFGKKGLLPSARAFPTTKPDATKLLRCLEDSLSGVIWRDDAQIVLQTVSKEYGEPARAVVTVEVLG